MVYLIDLKKFFENVFLLKRAWLKQQEFTQHGERSGKKFQGLERNHSSLRPMTPSSRVLEFQVKTLEEAWTGKLFSFTNIRCRRAATTWQVVGKARGRIWLCDLVAEMIGVHRGRHALQSGGANVLKGNLQKGSKCVHRGEAQHSEHLSATKLTVSEPLSILRKGIRQRSVERDKLTGSNDVCSSFNESNSGSHFSFVRGQIFCP